MRCRDNNYRAFIAEYGPDFPSLPPTRLSESKSAGREHVEVLCVVPLKHVPAQKWAHVTWTRMPSLQASSRFSIELTPSAAFACGVSEGTPRLGFRTCDAFDNVSTALAMRFLHDRQRALAGRHRRTPGYRQIDARRICSTHKWFASIPSGAPNFDTPLR